ncbi:hypothetical protein LTR56_026122 [Elasticomyces elasticus]|nr:hypothetical protein LTR56_026122 [Elasticomyces elasticus]KAK4903745.1 hypothetical protein LTR49_026670 [Elasticomyces elasticus]KAK5737961.1 hypothetical protein LTS12_025739 [Elasticomyces elasticus]
MKQPPDFLAGMRKDEPDVNVMDTSDQVPDAHHQEKPWTQDGNDGETQDTLDVSDQLPGGEEVWKDSVLGHPSKWSKALQSYAMTLSSFAYPAAIFWGEEFILLHNEAWTEASGREQQGQRQRGNLTADGFRALSSALHGGQQKRIASREILRNGSKDQQEKYTVLLSPLFAENSRKSGAAGLLAQMIPKPEKDRKRKTSGSSESGDSIFDAADRKVNISQLGTGIDNIPLDEHPFFHRFAEMLPSGLAILDHKAQCVFVNQHFYQLTTHKGDEQNFMSWPQSIHHEDYDRVMRAYQEAFESQEQLRVEFRSTGDQNPWRLLLLTPLGDENLQHVSLREYGGFICSLVDISSEKSAEISERKAAQEAVERKEQQERFIDMISHEIRNPLSAVMHSAEDLSEAISDKDRVDVPAIKEAIDTINLCLQHQQNIVNDVLSYSKLDASMLSLVPRPSHPRESLANTLKMFHPEFRKQQLAFDYKIDISYVEYNIDWVMADMARIGQVLVNLISNAIKFTAKSTGTKAITVMVGATYDRPTSYPPNVVFFGAEENVYKMDNTEGNEWGNGESCFILCAVQDTGIGISESGQKQLFERFRQATPKTSDQYGGSGLGLNISRKLCHLHGGEIGVSSKEGEGSTFGFFFKVKRTDDPGDLTGSRELQALDEDRLEGYIKAQGHEADSDVDAKDLPDSINNPPVEDTVAAPPERSTQMDKHYEHTLRVSNQVDGPEADSYKAADAAQSDKTSPKSKTSTREPTGPTELPSRPGQVTSGADGRPTKAGQDDAKVKQHVLLVEDNAINQRIVHRKLQTKGFQVTTANNGQEAVDAVRKAPRHSKPGDGGFDIILMDQEMPVLDGNAATRQIRELAEKGEVDRIPILGVTANVRTEQQDEMVISKPYKIDELVAKIDEVTKKAGNTQ